MDGMALLNDYVGGVQVTVKDDFSQVDSSLIQGETITLTGEQALIFVLVRGFPIKRIFRECLVSKNICNRSILS